ncbi:MAG: sulfate adenylyltransferase [Bacteroidota bacterium]|jgi:sulfate adenylyltransferase subunit 2
MSYRLNYLEELEAEAVFVLREAFAQFQNPCILFSGGKDSIVVTHLAAKAFAPGSIPFTLLHIDTGHNFPETLQFRDELAERMNVRLVVGQVEDSIKRQTALEETGPNANRNRAQSITLLESMESFGFDAAIGGGRRDEEKARAKERFFSHRDAFGQWDPKNQGPEIWHLFNGRLNQGEQFRVFPISNWTELDVWEYIQKENIALPSLYFAHQRSCVKRKETILAQSSFLVPHEMDELLELTVRFRTIGDLTISGALESTASTVAEIIAELKKMNQSERGNRADDFRSESSMEDRKKEGYF